MTVSALKVEPRTLKQRVEDLVLMDLSLSDPREIAERILGELTRDEHVAVLREVLPQYVRLILHNMRRKPSAGDPVAQGSCEHQRTSGSGSPRWRGAAKAFASIFDRRYSIGGPDFWKRLGDVTADDCLVLIREYRERAAANVAKAKQFRQLHDLMVERRVPRVEQLPEAEVAAIFNDSESEEGLE